MNEKLQRKVSLQFKVVVMAIVSVTLLAFLLVYFYSREMERAAYDALSKRSTAIATGLASECEYGLMAGNKTLLQQAAVKVLAQSDVTAAVIYDENGKLMAAAGKVAKADGTQLVQSHRQATFVSSPPGVGGRLAKFYMPILVQPASVSLDSETDATPPRIGQPLGLVVLTISQASTDAAVQQAQRTATMLTGLSALAVSLLALLSARRITRPLRMLVAGTEELAAGNVGARVAVVSFDEVGELAVAFNNMSTSLREMLEQIHERDEKLQQHNAALQTEIHEREIAQQNLKEFAAKLESSNRELQDFAYVASHDLQEPLRKIRAFGDRLQTKYTESLGFDGRDYLERMQNAAHRMQTLINDLLQFSRVTTKAQPFTTVDLGEVAREVLSDLETRIELTAARVQVADLPTIEADPLQMRQLIQNLVGNALKFHRKEEAPLIQLRCERNGEGPGHCRLLVQDNGIGFDEKYLDRIFGVFQRLHGRGEYEGTGVGLAICRKIAERHGGTITATSKPGQGATFIVVLPVHQQKNGETKHE